MRDRLRDPIWQFVGAYVALDALIVAVLFGLESNLHLLATLVGKLILAILILPPILLFVGLIVPIAVIKQKTVTVVSAIQSFYRSTWGRRILAFGLLLGLLILEYVRSQLSLWSVTLFALQLLLLLGLVSKIITTTTSCVLVYNFVDKFGEATLRNEMREEKIRVVEKALSKRPGGTEMRAIYAHPAHPNENTEVSYQLPFRFAVAQRLILTFDVAILEAHPSQGRESGFKQNPDNRARFAVRVNGKTEFTRDFDINDPCLFEWEHHRITITEVKGRALKIDFITHALRITQYNWTAWGEPMLFAIFSA